MPKPRAERRNLRRAARDAARRRIVAAFDALEAEPPQAEIAESGMGAVYLAELRAVRSRAAYWEIPRSVPRAPLLGEGGRSGMTETGDRPHG